ncbi:carbohydrate deacetylase isoform X3 [Macaca mulatta]|uniref:carbohydrate deacetylase isoform X3 n=1 Tax=Macaca mulatta TaxID=9544 RepID=UPI0010A22B54|nr:carbohydrate deacetylase isoform X3 [Macaca mulatta]
MSRPRVRLVVTADDFGYCPRRDEGIVEAFLAGAVTSVSLLVNGAATESAAELARRHSIPTGLHANLSEGRPVGPARRGASSLLGPEGFFLGKMGFREAVAAGDVDLPQVREELEAQLSCFRELMGRAPTHVDGHQHVHVLPDPLRPQACARCSPRRCRPMGCALRDCRWSAVWVAALGWRPPRAPSPAPWSATPGPPWAPSPATASVCLPPAAAVKAPTLSLALGSGCMSCASSPRPRCGPGLPRMACSFAPSTTWTPRGQGRRSPVRPLWNPSWNPPYSDPLPTTKH